MSQFWDAALAAQLALSTQFRPATDRITKELGIEAANWGHLATALSYEPEPISVKQVQTRNPYTAAQRSERQFQALKSHGLFSEQPAKEYRLTPEGRSQAQFVLDTQRAVHATVQPIAAVDMQSLAQLLRGLVLSAEKAPTPPGTWCLTRVRRIKPADNALPTTEVDHYLACLNAFRDDAHLSAWRAHEPDGAVWEALTLVWQGEATTAVDLSQKLAFREHSTETYVAALKQLEAKGLVTEQAGAFAMTRKGKALRDEVEVKTDGYFERSCGLPAAATPQLIGLVQKLHTALTKK